MKDKYNNIRVFKELKVSKESSYFVISYKDSFNKVVGSKQAFLINRAHFPVLKTSRFLRKHTDIDTNNTGPNDRQKIDSINKRMSDMMSNTTTKTDGNQDVIANLPSTLQGDNNGGTLSATAEEDDDATSNSNTTKQAWMSYNIKLLLMSKQDTFDSALQHAMLTILETID
jgi:hypothetical protein